MRLVVERICVRRTQRAGNRFYEQSFGVLTPPSSGGVTCKSRVLTRILEATGRSFSGRAHRRRCAVPEVAGDHAARHRADQHPGAESELSFCRDE